jgi:putative membrane protein
MLLLANAFIVLVAILHVWFLILEMFLWQKPLGLKTFRNSLEKAATTSVLAANQGLYNGFLAAGLFCSFAFTNSHITFAFQIFFLSCVIIAGIYGAYSVSKRILVIQALPAAIALALVLINSVQT